MQLYPHDLRSIADALDKLANLPSGVDIASFDHHQLSIGVGKLPDNQKGDGTSYYVTSIRDKIGTKPPVMRTP